MGGKGRNKALAARLLLVVVENEAGDFRRRHRTKAGWKPRQTKRLNAAFASIGVSQGFKRALSLFQASKRVECAGTLGDSLHGCR